MTYWATGGCPLLDTAIITTVLSTNRVDSRSFSGRCWASRRTHTSADHIRLLLCIRLALPLTLSLPSGFVPSARLMVGASLRALGLVGNFSCDLFWDERGGGLTPVGLQVDAATTRIVLSTNRVDSGSFKLTILCVPAYTHEQRRPYLATFCIRDTHRLGVERGMGRNGDTTAAVSCMV